VGDSLALSRLAASATGVDDRVRGRALHGRDRQDPEPGQDGADPRRGRGCSLADTINADQLREWKAEHPGAVVVAYVNTTAEVKAESDICCTSSNAVEVVESVPADTEILFLPDQFLGAHVRRVTGATTSGSGWASATSTRRSRRPTCATRWPPTRTRAVRAPRVRLLDVGAVDGLQRQVPAERTHILSTGGMLDLARTSTASKVLVATEIGMLHQLRQVNSATVFEAVNPAPPAPT
jgi:quinolinate synthase